jgi:hypothetical protein
MRLKEILFLTFVFSIFSLPLIVADGGYIPDYYLPVYEPDQKAVISWDEETETMILSSTVKSYDIANFAWIVPIQSSSKPNVEASDISIFKDLVNYFTEPVPYRGDGATGGGGGTTGGVVVIESKIIGIYNITILKATSNDDLIIWLNDNGYKIPKETQYKIVQYVDMKCTEKVGDLYFIVNKIDLRNIRQDVLYDLYNGVSTPIKLEFKPSQPYYPLGISNINTGYTDIEIYVITNRPVKDANKILEVDKSKEISSDLKNKLKDRIDLKSATFVTRLKYNGNLYDLNNDAFFSDKIPLKSLGKICWKDEECASGNCDGSWSICCKSGISCYAYENQLSCYNKCIGKEITITTTVESTTTTTMTILTTTTIQEIPEKPQNPNIFIRIYQRISNFFRMLLGK